MKIRFFGPVIRPSDEVVAAMQAAPPEGTIEDLLATLGYSPSHRRHVVVLVDGERLHPSDPIPGAGVDLTLMVPVGGG